MVLRIVVAGFVLVIVVGVGGALCQDMTSEIAPVDTVPHFSADDSVSLESIKMLIDSAQYAEAESQARSLLAEIESEHGAESLETASVLDRLVETLWRGGKALEPETQSLAERAVAIKEAVLGPEHLDVAASLRNLAIVFYIQRKHAEAEPLFERALAIRQKALGPDHPDVAAVLINVALVYQQQGKYNDAGSLNKRALEILENALGPEHPDVAKALMNLAVVYDIQGKYAEAEPIHKRALAIKEKALGPEHPEVAAVLNNLAVLCKKQGKYGEAEPLLQKALAIREKAFGPDHPDVTRALNNLAGVYFYQGKYGEAEPLYKRALAIREKALGPEHPDVAASLNDLAVVYKNQGKYSEAEPLYKRALAIWEKALGPEHPDLAMSLNNLATVYLDRGKYGEAEPLYKRTLAIREKAFGPEHPDVAASLNNLAISYQNQGKYADAEQLHKRALAIQEKALGPEHPDVAASLSDLAVVYKNQGKYSEAEPLYKRALAIWEKALGPEHSDLAGGLNNLAVVYKNQGKYAEAGSLYRRALAIWENALGLEHPKVAIALTNLGNLMSEQDKYAEAEPAYKRALAIREKAFGPEHWGVALSLQGLATLCSIQGRFTEAEPLFKRAITIYEGVLGTEHPDLAGCILSFSRLYRCTGYYSEALRLAERAQRMTKKNFRDNSSVMSERDALTYSRFLRESASYFLSAYFDMEGPNDRDMESAADVLFSVKGQASEAVFVRAAEMNMMAQLGEQADSLRQARMTLSNLYISGAGDERVAEYRDKLDRATANKERLESDLARSSESFRNLQEALDVGAEEVLEALGSIPGRVTLVEYMIYDYEALKPDTSIQHYLAVVMGGDQVQAVIDLGDASVTDVLVDRYRRHMLQVSDEARSPTVIDAEDYREISNALYERVWRPIEQYLTDDDLVMIAPDGGLNLIAFAGLMDESGKYLIEKFPLHYLSSGRDLIRLRDQGKSSEGLFVLGDPDYNATVAVRLSGEPPASDTSVVSTPLFASRNVRSGSVELRGLTAAPLPGTRREVEKIVEGWRETSDEPLKLFHGPGASEETFKSEAPGSRIVHLATHGYFLKGINQPLNMTRVLGLDQEAVYVGENPLLLSGLFFAGANLHGVDADSHGMEDGILTAEEVTAMNFDGTQLAVLSACETGLGEVESGEGVYGLRRAFQMAGVRTVVSALWPVLDEATAAMMSHLYESRSESLPKTLRRIQLQVIDNLRSEGKPDHPLMWGAFIAMGDWR